MSFPNRSAGLFLLVCALMFLSYGTRITVYFDPVAVLFFIAGLYFIFMYEPEEVAA